MSNTSGTIDRLSPERRALLALRALRQRKQAGNADDHTGVPTVPRVGGPQAFPLSFAQERIWFLDQLYPGNSGYNMPTAVRLRGRLDVAALEQSFNEIVRRHEALRTSFSAVDGRPVQMVAPSLVVPLPVVDLSDRADALDEAHRLAVEEAQLPFDLSAGPLLRTTLLRLAADDHVALLTMHHIVSDNWSMGILIREMAALYGAFREGKPSPLAQPRVQYPDYAQWRRDSLQGDAFNEQLSYWKRQLGGELPVLELPCDNPRPATPSFRGDKHEITFSKELTSALKTLGEREGATLYMTLLAAFQTLLYRYTAQDDICVGMPIVNRQKRELEGLIGFFVDTLVLRTDLSGNPSFQELLGRVREVALGAYAHQDLPFEKLVEELHVARDTGRQPLFQVMFVLQNVPQETMELPGLKLEPFDNALAVEIFDDLNLSLTETPQGLEGTLEYNADLFEATTIKRLVGHFEELLKSVVSDSKASLTQLRLLSETEEQQLLEGFNENSRVWPNALAVHEEFAQQAQRTPEAVALIFGERELTYRELDQQSNQLANYLRQRGAVTDSVVAIKFDRSAEMFIAMLAVLKAGAAYLPLDPAYPADRLAFMCEDAQPRLLLTSRNYSSENNEVVYVDDPAIAECSTEPLNEACPAEALAYVIYTSGSTGRPKGVCVTHRVLTNLLAWHRETLLGGVNTLGFASMSFDASIHEAFAAWYAGGTLVVAGDEERQDAEALARLISERRIAKAILPVVMLQQLAESEAEVRERLDSLREVTTTGEQLRITRAVRGLFKSELRECELHNHYGPSETHVVTALRLSREVGEWAAHPSIGVPVAGARMYVLDRELRPVPEGVRGEVYIGGEALGRGYWKRPGLTAERFIPDPHAAGGRLYRTGDVGRWLAGGELEYVGRVDQQVKVRGFRIEPGEIEAVLRNEARVSEAVVIARESTGGEKRLVGYVVAEAGANVTVAELRAYLLRELPEYMVPGVLVLLESLPLTPSGKVDRGALPDVIGQSAGRADYEAARTPEEEVLCGIWAEVLGVEGVSIHDDFFALGGDSIQSMRIVAQARRLGITLTVKEVFERPTVAQLAQTARITEPRSLEQETSQPDQTSEDVYPLSPLQQGILFHSLFAPTSGEYVEQFCGEWFGTFNVEAFHLAWQQVVARHPALRTAFFWENLNEPQQVVLEHVELPLEQYDWRATAEQEVQLREYLRAQQQTRIDPTQAPLMRLALFRLGDEHYRFAWSYHHLLLDGWSQTIVLKEVREIYQALCDQREARLASSRPYRNFIAWMRQQDLSAAEAFWRDHLKGFHTPTPLPGADTRFDRSYEQEDNKQQQAFVSEETTAALQTLAREHHLTLAALIQGAWSILLSRYSGLQDVLFGLTVAGRSPDLPDVESMVGLFINTLPLRVHVEPNASFIEWIKQVQALQSQVHEYEYSPLVQVQKWSDVPPGQRLFDHFIVFENYAGSDEESWAGEDLPAMQTGYPLYLSVKPGAALSLKFIYSTQHFSDASITRLLGHLRTLLEGVVREPASELTALPLLTAAERQTLLIDDNQTERDFPLQVPFHLQFEEQVAIAPDAVAVCCDRTKLSYRQLSQLSDVVAAKLNASGLAKGDIVALLAERSSYFVAAVIGIMKAGGVYLPLDPHHPANRQALMLRRAAVETVICAEQFAELLVGAREEADQDGRRYRVLDFAGLCAEQASEKAKFELPEVTASDVAYIIFTSGSTGQPKGAMIEQDGMLNHLYSKCVDLEINASDVVAQNAPQGFDISVWQMLSPLLVGARVEVISEDEARDPAALLQAVEARGVTVLETVPTMLHAMAEWATGNTARPGLEKLRWVISNAEALTVELAERWMSLYERPQLMNTWGATETSDDTMHERVTPGKWKGLAYVPLGQRLPNVRVYVVDSRGELTPAGVVGELLMAGVSVGRGYIGDPERTQKAFTTDYLRGDEARLYRTGDVVRWLEGGALEFVGRVDEQVKVRGFRVEPGEVEAVLRAQAGVSEAVVVARADGGKEKRLVGYVVTRPGSEVSVAELREAVRGQLPEYMVPSAVVVLEKLPLNANGKVDKRALPEPEYTAVAVNADCVGPRTPVEEVLCGIWSELLQVERVGIRDNFFELGGHSLLATQAMSRVREALGAEVPLRVLFESPTLEALASEVEATRRRQELKAPAIVAVNREQPLPLSFAQLRLWFMDQLEPANAAYNVPSAVRLLGDLNVGALAASLSEVVRRHESLRTTFVSTDAEPLQVIAPAEPMSLPVTDLRGLAEREQEAQRLAHAEAAQTFDLARGPLVRASLLKLGDEEHILLFTMHHIVSDGWSMGILVNEVATLYGAYLSGAESPLEELPIQYGDYAVWQREWLQGEVLEKQLSYWRGQLAGAPAVLELPTDHARPVVQSFRGAKERFRLSAELTRGVNELGRSEGVTLNMLLLAAFQTLLHRYTGQEDICVGSPIANRNLMETEKVIGFFLNTLVLRTNLSGQPSFREVLKRVREVALGAYAHQDLPFEKLVEEMDVARDTGRQPLFQVMFAMQNAQPMTLTMPGLKLEETVDNETATAKFDLNLFVAENPEGLEGTLEYSTDLFEAATIKRLMGHFEELLQSVVSDPTTSVTRLRLLSETEEQRLLEGFNENSRVWPSDLSLHEEFTQQAERTPDAIALVFGERELSYRELEEEANRLARYLMSRGAGRETLVGIELERSAEMFVALLAVLKTGAAYLPLDPSYPAERVKYMCEDAQPKLLLTEQRLVQRVSGCEVICLDDEETQRAISECASEAITEGTELNSLAYVIYTSGSTGRPKGVCVTHGLMKNLLGWHRETLLGGVNTLGFASLSFDASIHEAFAAWYTGGALVVAEEEIRRDAAALARLIGSRKIEKAILPVVLLQQLAESDADVRDQLRSLRELTTTGEQLRITRAVRALFAGELQECELHNHYGPSETHVVTAYELGREPEEWAAHPSIGRPVAGARLYVLDQELRPVPEGVRGEVYIGGEAVGRGYWNRPSLTAERFIPDPYENGGRLYRTGDVGRWLANGELEYVGRVDQQVKIRGFRIEPGEIEAALRRHEKVSEAVVVVREGARGEKRLVGYVVSEAGERVTVSELREHLLRELPEYMVPGAIVQLEKLPVTPSGKVDRGALPEVTGESVEGREYEGGRTPVEEVLCAIWGEVLGVERVSIHDDFFALGGHSLLATQAMSRIRRAFNIELPLRSLFETTTVARLAERVAEELLRREGVAAQPQDLEPVSREGALPLSFAQQRLWFIDQMEPGNPFYNIPMVVRLKGDLRVEALERTVTEIVRRHESLRTSFAIRDGEPVQVISLAGPVSLPVTDLSELVGDEREQEASRLTQAEAERSFDLSNGPLLRASLLRLAADEHIALLTMHHIVSDGWSMGVLVNEVATLYRAYSVGEESPLEELTIQYADYAAWQREWLQGEVLDNQLSYWKQQLAGAPAVLELPTDHARPAVQSYRGASESFELSAELTSKLEQLSRREGVTLYMTLLAAFQTLLYRYTGQADIVVGSPIANRTRVETEALIGFFINMLALRGRLNGEMSFAALLGQAREVTLGAYAHQDLPFEKLVEELQPERSLSHSPIFQVMMVLQNAPGAELELPGLRISAIEESIGVSKLDLNLSLIETGAGLLGGLEYNTDLFERETIKRMVRHFERVLEAVVCEPQQQLSAIAMLDEAEQQKLLIEFNPSGKYRNDKNVHELFEEQVAQTPDAVALVFDEQSLTYRELNERANQLAAYLQELGVGPEVPVAVLMERSLELVVSLLAVLKAGGAYLPLDADYPSERLAFMCEDAGVRFVLTQERFVADARAYAQVVCVDTEWESIAQARTFTPAVVSPDALAYIMYTSGSTGRPKGVSVTHRGIVRLAHRPSFISVSPDDTFVLLAPVTFDASTLELWASLLNGARLVIAPPQALSLAELGRLLAQHEVSVLWLTAGLFHLMVEERVTDLAGVREMLAGGDVVSAPAVQRLLETAPGLRFSNGYGPTENTTFTCCHAVEAVSAVGATTPIGRPITGTQVYVLDANLKLVAQGVVGELYTGGAGLARGYLGRAGLTAERFVPNPYGEPGARLYRTGDLVRWVEGGMLEFVGRVDEQVKVRGFRIELGEIEAALLANGKVSEAVVVARADESGEKRLVGYVVGVEGEPVSGTELREHLLERLPEYMVPSAVVVLSEFPLNANGKVDKRALPDVELATAVDYVGPRTPIEEMLCGIWSELLRVERVGINDNFFELGGHSLLATQAMSRLREAFGAEVPLRVLFESPTVESLAQEIEAVRRGEQGLIAPPIVAVNREQALPLSFAQQRLWFIDQLEPTNAAYNVPLAMRLTGSLNVEAFERTLSEVFRRHESLRTTFVSPAGEPLQVIMPAGPVSLPVTDLRELPADEREREALRLTHAEAQRPFDLSTGPVARASLLQLSDEEYIVLFTMHHIISDGWSLAVLINEVATIYEAYLSGAESPLEELPIQYGDYAVWQREWLQGEVLENQLLYWRQQLERAPAVLELPTDHARPPMQSFRGASESFRLPADLSRELQELSRRENVTLYMTLLAAFQTLLYRYTGQEDICVGSPIANRNLVETEKVIGFFLNTLVLRTNLSGQPSFREVLKRVREVALGAYAHQDLPFEKLVEEMDVARDTGRQPLFQVMFAMQNAQPMTLTMPGLKLEESVDNETATAKFDLNLFVAENPEGLEGTLEYSTDLFEAATIKRLMGHFEELLQSVVSDATTSVTQLRMLSEAEAQRLLEGFNENSRVWPSDLSLHEEFTQQVERTPEVIALVFGERELSYRELEEEANRLARYLKSRGAGRETLVGIELERSAEMFVALLAVLKTGAAYLPLDPSYPAERVKYMCEDAQPKLLLTERRLVQRVSGCEVICLDDEQTQRAISVCAGEAVGGEFLPEMLAYVIYTSGSTGRPKGVCVTHGLMKNLLGWHREATLGEVNTLGFASLSFDMSIYEAFAAWTTGGALVVADEETRRDAAALAQLIGSRKIQKAMLPVLMLQQLAELEADKRAELSCLREVITAGEQLRITRAVRGLFTGELHECELQNHYGPAETHVVTALPLSRQVNEWAAHPSIGVPVAGARLYVLDQNLRPVPEGVRGEIYIGGEAVGRGYWKRPSLTAERFIPNPFENGRRLYRTGDAGRWLAGGELEYVGRVDQQVKIRGFRIEPGEIEAVLRNEPRVSEAVIVTRDTSGEKRLVGYVVAEPGATVTVAELRAHLRQELPDFMVPGVLVLLESLPLTPSGKLDRRALPEVDEPGAGNDEYEAARTPVEEVLCGIWGEVLGVERVSIHDDFFALGGHSLLATQAMSRIRRAFNIELPLRSLFETTTVAELGEKVAEELLRREGVEAQPQKLSAVSRDGVLPLSFAQQRLWFIDQLEPGGVGYNLPTAMRLKGELKVEALERTVTEIVRRHESLRTSFAVNEGEPVQVISPVGPVSLPVIDLSELATDEREQEASRLTHAEAQQPFDLSNGPLFRMSLLRLAADEHIALLTMHHIVSDGWSMGVLVNEVATLYGAYSAGEESPLAELPIQYADYAAWQREWLQGEVLESQLSYWKQQLAGAPAVLELPTDHARPAVQSYRGTSESFELSAELTRKLEQLSRREGVTLYMTLLAAFQTLLYRYTGQKDLVIGTSIAERTRVETEGLIGLFVNMLPLRGRLSGEMSFATLLGQAREVTLGAYAHQELPFEKLVEELQPERSLSHAPIFQVMMVLQNAPGGELELPGLRLTPLEGSGTVARFDLNLSLVETGNGMLCGLEYNTDLFERETIKRMVRHFERVLEAVVFEPQQQLSAIEMLDEVERQQLLLDFNPSAEYRHDKSVHELFEEQVALTPDAVALVFDDQILTYRKLNERAEQLAAYMQELGIGPEVPVGVLMERSLELVVSLLAVLKAGGAYLPLDPEYPSERLSFMLADAGVLVILTQERLAEELPANWAQVVCVDTEWESIAQARPFTPAAVSPDSLAYIMYTSGSTGRPKGVSVTHRGIVRLAHRPSFISVSENDTFVLLAPVTFDASTLELWASLLNGARLVIAPPQALSLAELGRLLAQHEVSVLWLTAGLFHLMVEERVTDLAGVREMLAGGDVVSAPAVRRLLAAVPGLRFSNGYGPTENTTFTCCHAVEAVSAVGATTPIGRPITGTQVYVLDANLKLVAQGVVGELYTGGAGLARGYLGRAGLTAERFVPNPYGEPGARLYRTGDLVRWVDGGLLEFVGRVDEQVKVRGFRIELGEIEAALLANGKVSEAVVVARADESGEKRLVGYVVGVEGEPVSGAELREHLLERLPEYMVPSAVVVLSEFPLNANGKVDKRALPEVERHVGEESDFRQARTPVEEVLCGIWAEVLRVERVGINDNLFELGGHSLLGTQIISRVREAFQVEVPLRVLFESPTVEALADHLEMMLKSEAGLNAPPVEPRSRESAPALSFGQQRLWFIDQMEPGNSFYNIPVVVRLTGELRVEALERTVNEIVRRHESLRTSFAVSGGEPIQVISPAGPVSLPVTDLSGLAADEREREASRLTQAEAERSFDLSNGPLLRASLLRLAADEHIALLTMHHIVSDGWSMGVLVNEVATLYRAYSAGEESPLEELAIQYADYAAWQRNWLQGEVLDNQLSYWKQQLAGAPAVLELPTDHARPAVQTYRGASESFELSAELTSKLEQLSRREGVTLYMTLLAAFQTLLYRYTGQADIVVGSPIANRTRVETEALIGFFINMLALRGRLNGEMSFAALLGQAREVTLGAYAHQDLPFEKLVEELQPERSLSHSPIFQVMMVLQNAPGGELELPGLRIGTVDGGGSVAKFDLNLSLLEMGGGMLGGLEYNTDLFEQETIKRMVRHFERVLEAVVCEPQQQLSAIAMLDEDEQQQLLVEFNQTSGAEYRRDKSVHELFEEQVARTPDAVAVVFEDESLTYRELNERANQLGAHLQELGVGPEVLVGVMMERSLELAVSLLAVLKAGGAYLPLDAEYPSERLAFMCADAGVRLLLTQSGLAATLRSEAVKVLEVDVEREKIARRSGSDLKSGVAGENAAYVIYTSGSTGRPKGALITHNNLRNHMLWMQEQYPLGAEDAVLQKTAISFDASVWEFYAPLLAGARLVLARPGGQHDLAYLAKVISAQQVTVLQVVPALLRALLSENSFAQCGSLRRVFSGGEVLMRELQGQLAEVLDVQLINLYGPTETTIQVLAWNCEKGSSERAVPLGRPLSNVKVYVLDESLQSAPVGVCGEIYVGGAAVGRGYVRRPGLTAARFVPDPYSATAGARLYRTGDLGRWRGDGVMEYVGRVDEQVKVRGFRIELGEIETVLRDHRSVREAVVITRGDGAGGSRLIGYVVPEGQEPTNEELRSHLLQKVPDYMVPTVFMMLEELPLNASGKVDRRGLPEVERQMGREGEYEAPRTPVEEVMCGIWAEVLQVERVGIRESFFDLGGHSLLAMQVIARVRAEFGVEINVRDFFLTPNVKGIALSVVRAQGEATAGGEEELDRLLAELEESSLEDLEQQLAG